MMLKKLIFYPLIFTFLFGLLNHMQAQGKYGELRQFIYKSKTDSLLMIATDELIATLESKRPMNLKKIDSLLTIKMRIYADGTFRIYYRPSRDFVISDSVNSSTDLSTITNLSINGKDKIPAFVYQCKNLNTIEFLYGTFNELPKEFNQLTNLQNIYIYHHQSKKPLRFARNSTITNLSIRTQTTKNLPRSYKNLRGLLKLDLSENNLVKFPNGSRRNKKLRDLSLQRNQLTLAGRIKKHPYLERLSLHGNQIEHVPASIGKFINLKKLNFNINKIKTVHSALGSLSKLEQLSFYNNKLTSIPTGVYRLTNLIEIDLFHNQIEQVDKEFASWRKLETLYLSHNRLTTLPENLDTLKNLTGLYAWDNRIGALPLCISKMQALKYLRINHNYIKSVPPISHITSLEEIDLSHNYITDLPESIFDLPNLKILALVNNPWSKATLEFLHTRAEQLRTREVSVHLTDKD
jgi:Leucine-rich repeat (LRR) protein